MRSLILTEHGAARSVALSDREANALAQSELGVVTRSPDGRGWLVAAGRKVGVARLGDLQVMVTPKVPVDRLIFLMGYARDPAFWRDHTVTLDSEADLVEALAHAFRRHAARALDQGLLQGYRTVDDALPVLRGRVRVKDQIRRRFGSGLPLEVTYDDFTVDIAENQILLAATLKLLRAPGVPTAVRSGLQRLRVQLADVTDVRGHVPHWQPSRINARYQPALRLAQLILDGDSLEQRVGDLDVTGFVVDMWRVFEEFVSVALAEALAHHGGTSSSQHRMHLDEGREVDLRPDFLWTRTDGRQAVVDAKYKVTNLTDFPHADLYQLLAYCTVLQVRHGHLIYAQGSGRTVSHQVMGSGVALHCHTLNLTLPPADLLAQVARIATLMAELVASGTAGAHKLPA